MEAYRLENFSFKYPNGKRAIESLDFAVKKGEFVTICGKSGCGKTTLLRLLKPAVAPHGEHSGKIMFGGKDIAVCDEKVIAQKIGFVMQNPENQIVTDKVWHELCFGLENFGIKSSEIRIRVAEIASFFGIESWFYKKTSELSGGQKQILNLAAVMVMQPEVLILDEPTARLDPIAAEEFLKALKKINDELGITVIIAEHRVEETFSLSDRIIVMEKGGIIADSTPRDAVKILKEQKWDMYSALPCPSRVFESVKAEGNMPITIREGRAWLSDFSRKNALREIEVMERPVSASKAVEVKELFFRYEKSGEDVIKNLNLTVYEGEVLTIFGGNGSGKTTAVSLISGIYKSQRGEIYINGTPIDEEKNLYDGILGVMPQEPQSLFAKKTVYLELMEMTDKKLPDAEREKAVTEILTLCGISDVMNSHPYDLSGGEQQRAALAMVLLKKPRILILDEPTKGMDAHFKGIFKGIISDLKRAGVTIIMVSHDLDFCAEIADRCALFYDGAITAVESSRKFFLDNCFYTTSACRMARGIIGNAVTTEDIICAIGGEHETNGNPPHYEYKMTEKKELPKKAKPRKISQGIFFALCFIAAYFLKLTDFVDFTGKGYIFGGLAILFFGLCAAAIFPSDELEISRFTPKNKRLRKRTKAAVLLILLVIPLTIFFGIYYLGDRKYYLISLLIILETLLPFVMIFENRRAEAREIVLVSVLCAIGVAGRTAFFMLPEFKPLLAIIILSGICLGGEVGFTVGAMTGFVSNFFFGQGPWTPWQMFALGIIGFISGLIFKTGMLKTKLSLSIFGFFAALLVYGGIMNPASVLMVTANPTKAMIYSAFLTGFPVDLIHAMSTALFLWLLSEPMIEKIERIKVKYGLLEDRV